MSAQQQGTDQIIEVRAGVGDPPSMRAVPGTQLGPLSVGHRAAWKVVAVGVRDEHAFLYFDGATVFVQSVDPQNPAFVNGEPVSKEWTPVPVGSEIAFGEARMAVAVHNEAAVQVSKSNRPFAPGEFVNEDSVVPVRGKQSAAAPSLVTSDTAVDRPFSPGEFANQDPDVTRMAPIEELAAAARPRPGPPRGGTVQMAAIPPGQAPNPAIPPAATSSNPYGPMGGDPNMMMGSFTPMGGVPMAQPHGMMQPDAGPPGNGMAGQTGATQPSPVANLLEKAKTVWQTAPPPRKAIFVLTPFVLISVVIVFGKSDDPPPPLNPPAPTQQTTTTAAPTATPAQTVGPISPPTAAPSNDVPQAAAPDAGQPIAANTSTPQPPSTAPRPPGSAQKKTLERAAADAVAAGAFLEAAALYEQLAREHPENPSFAEAARILRNKSKPTAQ
jgi:hypothetical protein